MLKSSLAVASRTIAFILALHLLGPSGFASTATVRHKHRQVSATARATAAKRPARAAAQRVVPVVSRTPARAMAVQSSAVQSSKMAGPRPIHTAPPCPAVPFPTNRELSTKASASMRMAPARPGSALSTRLSRNSERLIESRSLP